MKTRETKADERLQRVYGITLPQYNERFIDQGGVCALCLRPPKKFRLNIDHDHRFDRVTLFITKIGGKSWRAFAIDPHGMSHTTYAESRADARQQVKKSLRRASIRGLLCYQCNKGLAYYRDSSERLDRAAIYLRRFNEKMAPAFASPVVIGAELHSAATGDCAELLSQPSLGRDVCVI